MWIAEKPDLWDRQTAIILAHGAGQGMESPFMTFFHQEMAARGFLSVKFNFEYMTEKRKFPDSQPKLRAFYRQVIAEVQKEYKPARVIIGGKSMGGRVASYIAKEAEGVVGLVFLGYPLHPPGKPDQMRDEHLYELDLPMLFISGTRDTLARRDLLKTVTERIGSRATMLWIEGGDHSLKTGRNDKTSLKTAADAMEQWILVQSPRRLDEDV